jgi:hypothetical protein
MCNMLRQSISSQVMQTLASLLLHYDQIPTAQLALTHTFIYWRESNGFVAVFIYFMHISLSGAPGRVVVEVLRYKPEGRGFDSRWCHWNFLLTQSFRPHCANL